MSGLALRQQATAADMFHYLVTPSGTGIAHGVDDLVDYAGAPDAEIRPVLTYLAGLPQYHVLRPVSPPPDRATETRYEIFHDVLAAAILDWRARFERGPFRWRLVLLATLAVVLASIPLPWLVAVTGVQVLKDIPSTSALVGLVLQATAAAIVSVKARRLRPVYGLAVAGISAALMFLVFFTLGWSSQKAEFTDSVLLPSFGLGLLSSCMGGLVGSAVALMRGLENQRRRGRSRRQVTWAASGAVALGVSVFTMVVGWSALGFAAFVVSVFSGITTDTRQMVVHGLVVLGGVLVAAIWASIERPRQWWSTALVAVWWGVGGILIKTPEVWSIGLGLLLQLTSSWPSLYLDRRARSAASARPDL